MFVCLSCFRFSSFIYLTPLLSDNQHEYAPDKCIDHAKIKKNVMFLSFATSFQDPEGGSQNFCMGESAEGKS